MTLDFESDHWFNPFLAEREDNPFYIPRDNI